MVRVERSCREGAVTSDRDRPVDRRSEMSRGERNVRRGSESRKSRSISVKDGDVEAVERFDARGDAVVEALKKRTMQPGGR